MEDSNEKLLEINSQKNNFSNPKYKKNQLSPDDSENSCIGKMKNEKDFSSCSKLKIKFSFDLNKNSQKSHDNSLLMIKENKTNPSEFLVANSDFTLDYYRFNESDVFLMNTYKEHSGRINDVSFFNQNQHPFENCFITGSSDSTMKIWDHRSKYSAQTLKCNNILKKQKIIKNTFLSLQ